MSTKLRHSAAEYPYDPAADINDLHGLDRLRAIRDRRMAQNLFDLYWIAERNEARMSSQRRNELEQDKRDAEDWEDLQSMASKALDGIYGKESRRLAEDFLGGRTRTRPNLEELRKLLRKVPGRISG